MSDDRAAYVLMTMIYMKHEAMQILQICLFFIQTFFSSKIKGLFIICGIFKKIQYKYLKYTPNFSSPFFIRYTQKKL